MQQVKHCRFKSMHAWTYDNFCCCLASLESQFFITKTFLVLLGLVFIYYIKLQCFMADIILLGTTAWKPMAEFKEFERRFKFKPLFKYGWFYLKLYQMFQDLSRR